MREHTTHHDDCGCLSARYEAEIKALRSEIAALREKLEAANARLRVATFRDDGATTPEGQESAGPPIDRDGPIEAVDNGPLAGLPAGYYVFRKKWSDADSSYDAMLLTPEAIASLGDSGVSESAFTMTFAECVEALRREAESVIADDNPNGEIAGA